MMNGGGSGVEQISRLIGWNLAKRLCQTYGGVGYYIPQKPREDHPFAGLLGMQAWERLCAYYGGTRLTLPRMEHEIKRRQVMAMLREGRMSPRQIALEAGATERYVRKLAAKLKNAETRELPLFAARGD